MTTHPAPSFRPPLANKAQQDETTELRPAFNAEGLVAAIAQDVRTGDVLMLAWMNADALNATLDTGVATYWSRSRGKLWVKGETSGHTQIVKSVHIDCDQDAILVLVEQAGGACHTGRGNCFYRQVDPVTRTLNHTVAAASQAEPSPPPKAPLAD